MAMKNVILIFILLFSIIITCFIFLVDKSLFQNYVYIIKPGTLKAVDSCILPQRDPWDPSISRYFSPQNNPMAKCKPKHAILTSLVSGQLFLHTTLPSDAKCQHRCLLPKTDYKIVYEKWIGTINGTKPKCDVIEVECNHFNETKPFYRFLHAQVYRDDAPDLVEPEKPDVHMLILDSVSHSQFRRSLPKTLILLVDNFKAVSFPNLNKIGYNSRDNAFGFFIGKAMSGIPKSPFTRGYISDYGHNKQACKTNLDNDQFIGFRFQDDGYVTMQAEDWRPPSLMWPNCKGFTKPPTNHYMAPFRFQAEKAGLLKTLYGNVCREPHLDYYDYLKSFIKAYPDKPKFSVTWSNKITHDDSNGLYHVDNYFYRFFNESKEELKNAFIIFMADHGMRFGKIRKTELGVIEDNNPFLFVILPEKLRHDKEVIHQLRDNADQLVTHYDIYATLVDIVNPKNPRIPNPLLKGSSLLKPLPQPRNCETLQIPDSYCLCQKKKTRLPENNTVAAPLTQYIISQINDILLTNNDTFGCSELTLNLTAKIDVIEYEQKKDPHITLYQITFTTLPGNGIHQGFVTRRDNGEIAMISEKLTRLDSYDKQSKCAANSQFRNYCYCKNLNV